MLTKELIDHVSFHVLWLEGWMSRRDYFGPVGGEALVSCRRCIIIGVRIQVDRTENENLNFRLSVNVLCHPGVRTLGLKTYLDFL